MPRLAVGLCAFAARRLVRAQCTKAASVLRTSDGVEVAQDAMFNIHRPVLEKMERNLLQVEQHPLRIIKDVIAASVGASHNNAGTSVAPRLIENRERVVGVWENFDSVLVPADHVSRSKDDTYYVNKDYCLRTHTSAHQVQYMKKGLDHFLLAGDVYRRDTVDATHSPVFHQMEGVRLFDEADVGAPLFDATQTESEERQAGLSNHAIQHVSASLKSTLERLVHTLFGDVPMRWVDAYFPFTHPSWEVEIYFNDEWLEVLGCGVIQQQVLNHAGRSETRVGWAYGLGLERLAMVLYNIPDIRLFWSTDPRFLAQFRHGNQERLQFVPFSKYPPSHKDMSFWIEADDTREAFTENSLCELVRGVAGDCAESVTKVSEFVKPSTNQTSMCYRITYRAMDRSMTNDEVNRWQVDVRTRMQESMAVALR